MDTSGTLPPSNKKKRIWRIVLIILLIVALVAVGVLAYLWYDERNTARQLRDRVANLEALAPRSEPGDTPTTPAQLCASDTTSYTAETGKFTVAIPDSKYVIIKNHEGAGEGGPSSQISLGTCFDAANNVVESNTNEKVSLDAIPASNWEGTTFSQWVTGRLEDHASPHELGPITIDGVSARDFRTEGLFESRVTFFENNGIWYEINALNMSSEATPAARTALIEGFSFTE